MTKELENKLSQYSSKMKDQALPNGLLLKTHSVIALLEELGYNICRVDVGQLNGRGSGDPTERNRGSISPLVTKIYEEYVCSYGSLPWLAPSTDPVQSVEQESKHEQFTAINDSATSFDSIHVEELAPQSQSTMNQLNQLNDEMRSKVFKNADQVILFIP